MSTTRRRFIASSVAATGLAALAPRSASAEGASFTALSKSNLPKPAFRYCLNTSTIRGQIQAQTLDLVAQARKNAGMDGQDECPQSAIFKESKE